jgi:hypothetical protein
LIVFIARLSPKQHEIEEDLSEFPDVERNEKLPRVSEDSESCDKVSSTFGYGE